MTAPVKQQTETCTCVPGKFLCPKAERLWRMYFELRDAPEGRRARLEYDEHMRVVMEAVNE